MIQSFFPIASVIIKILTLVGLSIYLVFAAVIVRQERLMSAVLDEGFEPVMRILTLLHMAAAIGVFILALIGL